MCRKTNKNKYVEFSDLLWNVNLKVSSDTFIDFDYFNLSLKMKVFIKHRSVCIRSNLIKSYQIVPWYKVSSLNRSVAFVSWFISNRPRRRDAHPDFTCLILGRRTNHALMQKPSVCSPILELSSQCFSVPLKDLEMPSFESLCKIVLKCWTPVLICCLRDRTSVVLYRLLFGFHAQAGLRLWKEVFSL